MLVEAHATALVGSLAEGADQECAEIALGHGLSLQVIVPSEGYASTFDDSTRERYVHFLSEAEAVTTLDFAEPSEEAFYAAGKRVVDDSDLLVAVWDGKPAAGTGGTGDVVDYAITQGKSVRIIWPDGVSR
ncbi:hypothetical protein [Nocardioides aquaticus]|uniref:hypothetical protein n=1 Tax=Nocardioides aquaticus TaxID=160826 RepID=UPI001BD3DDF9|nr:hypothetical protein [Nocardioides aquaticus]